MKNLIVLFAVLAQLLTLIVCAAKYDLRAGLLVLCAITANAIQSVLQDGKK